MEKFKIWQNGLYILLLLKENQKCSSFLKFFFIASFIKKKKQYKYQFQDFKNIFILSGHFTHPPVFAKRRVC